MPVTISGIRSTSAILVPQGGTGNAQLQSGSLLIGNGTDAVGVIAPGSEGQILTVVSGAWMAAANAGGNGGAGISAVSSSGNLQGDGTSGSVLTLKNNISLTSVTASFSGSGTGLTNIPNSALQNSYIEINGTQVALGGNMTILTTSGMGLSVDASVTNMTGSGFSVGNVVALSGSLVKADYSSDMRSNAMGVISEVVDGTTVKVKLFGEATTVTSGSAITGVGTPLYVGENGNAVTYANIPSGKFITQIGYIGPNNGYVVLQFRVFGQK